MGKYDNKINKKKENNEPFDLEKYIDDIELYRKERELLDLLEILKTIESIRAKLRIPIIRIRKAPEIRLRFVELDTSLDPELMRKLNSLKPRKQTNSSKMKVEWIE